MCGHVCSEAPADEEYLSDAITNNIVEEVVVTSTPASDTVVPSTPTASVKTPGSAVTCEDGAPSAQVQTTIWAEWASGLTKLDDAQEYYSLMASFLKSNCAGLKVNKLVLRMFYPTFPSATKDSYFAPTTEAPLFGLLKQLASTNVTEVHFYPYVMDSYDQKQWLSYSNGSDVLSAAFQLADSWRSFMNSQGLNGSVVKGLVLDYEEVIGQEEILNDSPVESLKTKYNFTFGMSTGFDDKNKLKKFRPLVDRFYLQAYDFYVPTSETNRTSESIFLKSHNDADALVNYVNGQAITSGLWDFYAENSSDITLMWSLQSMDIQTEEKTLQSCLFPLKGSRGSTCGANNEFGSWSPFAFNQFLQKLNKVQPTSTVIDSAIYSFTFLPRGWLLPENRPAVQTVSRLLLL